MQSSTTAAAVSRRSPRLRIRARAARDRRPSSGSGAGPSLALAARRTAPRNSTRPRDRQQRRHERERHERPHERRHRHARPERPEEAERAQQQRAGAGGDDQAGRDDDGHDAHAGAVGGLARVLAGRQPAPHLGQEEDAVVRDDREQQHEHERPQLAGHRDVDEVTDRRHHPEREPVRDAGHEQREQRREQRAQRDREHERDDEDGADLDVGQRLVDLALGLHARRDRAGHADPPRLRVLCQRGRVLVGAAVLLGELRARLEVEVRDDRRRRRRRAGHLAERVRHRQRAGQGGDLQLLEVDGLLHSPRLCVRREALRVVLDDLDLGQQREAERLVAAHLRLDGLRLHVHEPLGGGALAAAQIRQVDRGRHDRRDPDRQDRPARPHHGAAEGAGQLTRAVGTLEGIVGELPRGADDGRHGPVGTRAYRRPKRRRNETGPAAGDGAGPAAVLRARRTGRPRARTTPCTCRAPTGAPAPGTPTTRRASPRGTRR